MAILNNFKFFDETSTSPTSNILSNVNATELVLEVSGTATPTLIVEGLVNNENTNWTVLSTINMTDYSIADRITANGIYTISAQGISKIRISHSTSATVGSVNVFGKLVN